MACETQRQLVEQRRRILAKAERTLNAKGSGSGRGRARRRASRELKRALRELEDCEKAAQRTSRVQTRAENDYAPGADIATEFIDAAGDVVGDYLGSGTVPAGGYEQPDAPPGERMDVLPDVTAAMPYLYVAGALGAGALLYTLAQRR